MKKKVEKKRIEQKNNDEVINIIKESLRDIQEYSDFIIATAFEENGYDIENITEEEDKLMDVLFTVAEQHLAIEDELKALHQSCCVKDCECETKCDDCKCKNTKD